MKGFKKTVNILLSAVMAAVLLLCAFGCDTGGTPAQGTPIVPGGPIDPSGDPSKPSGTTAPAAKVDGAEFLAKVFNRGCENFTLSFEAGDEDEQEEFVCAYDYSRGYDMTYAGERHIYSDGLLYTLSEPMPADLPAEDDDEEEKEEDKRPFYTATTADNFLALARLSEEKLTALFKELFEMYEYKGEAALDGKTYTFTFTHSSVQKLSKIIEIGKEKIDEPAINAVTAVFNLLTKNEFTPDALALFLPLYGDTAANTLVLTNPVIALSVSTKYAEIRELISPLFALPSWSELLASYGDRALSDILKTDFASLVKKWKEKSLRECLEEYDYTFGTAADFFLSSAETVVNDCSLNVTIKSDTDFRPISVKIERKLDVEDIPVIEESLLEGGKKETLKDISREDKKTVTFSEVGTSKVASPERYAVVGEQVLKMSANYPVTFKAGCDNTRSSSLVVTVPDAPVSTDPTAGQPEWLPLVRAVMSGTKVDYEKYTLTLDRSAVDALGKVYKLGFTAVKLTAYKEFDFVLTV